MRYFVWLACACALCVSACGDEHGCSDEVRIAVTVTVEVPGGGMADRVTVERDSEATCGLVSARDIAKVYQCWEQGGGGEYVVRVYKDDQVWSATEDVPGDGCHVSQRAELDFDLSLPP